MLRRFEHAGPPARFWEIADVGHMIELRWGESGRQDQRHMRSFATYSEGARYMAEQIAAQLAKGYIETTRPSDPAAVIVESPEQLPPPVSVTRRERFTRAAGEVLVFEQEGQTVITRGGSAGDAGDVFDNTQRSVEPQSTVAAASALFAAYCADARSAGWQPASREVAAAIHHDAALEAECLASPDAPEPWAVYADWLIARGDPRGEIAALHIAGKHAEATLELGAHLELLTGGAHRAFPFQFRHGFVVGATVRLALGSDEQTGLAEVTCELLAAPIARHLESLRFGLAGFSTANDWAPTLRAVIESARAPHIRELRFDAYTYEDSEISWTPYGDFTGLLARLPALELVHLRSGAGGTLGELDLPRLRTFIRESGGLGAAELEAICTARWPALEHLEVWFGSSNYGAQGSVPAIRAILDGKSLPRLGHLGIVNCEFVDDAIDALASSKILPRLYSLDLTKGVLARRGARSLVANAAKFRHLASIDLRENLLEPDEVAQIRAVLDNVITSNQREREEDYVEDDEDEGAVVEEPFRYVATGE